MSKHIINWTVHEYKCLFLTFVFLQIEREREWYTKFGYKGEMAPKLLILFLAGFHWRIFLLSRANWLCSIFFLHWLEELGVLRVSVILLSSTRSKMAMVRLPATNPAQKLIFLSFTSAEGKGAPLPFWGPSQSFGFSLFPLPVSGDLRLLSTNTWSPLCDPHSSLNGHFFLTARYC